MKFQRYNSIENAYRQKFIDKIIEEGHAGGEWIVQEKIHGCFHHSMGVHTENGVVQIGKLVNKKMDIKVKSYNKKTGKIEYKNIINWYKNGYSDNWLEVIVKDEKNHTKKLIVTSNHKVYCYEKGWCEVGNLKNGDFLFLGQPELMKGQFDVLLGSLLGNGSLQNVNKNGCNPLYIETHSLKQSQYLLDKKRMLDNLGIKVEYLTSAFSKKHKKTKKMRIVSRTLSCLNSLTKLLYDSNGKKKIYSNIIGKLTPLSLAIWYCDDGHLPKWKPQYGNSWQRPRIKFHTEGFTKDENEFLIKELKRFGYSKIKIVQRKNKELYYIQFSADDSELFFENVYYYIPKSMNYKLPKKYHNFSRFFDESQNYKEKNTCPIEVISIKNANIKNRGRYDIEVEDNHNYFVKNILVSNSNLSMWYDGNEFKCAKRGGFLKENEKFYNWQLIVKIYKNAVEDLYHCLDRYYKGIEYITIFGELFGGSYPHPEVAKIPNATKIQKGIFYCPSNSFYAFDLVVDGNYIDTIKTESHLKSAGFFYAETLFTGTLEECLEYPNDFLTTIPKRLWLPPIEHNICEGIVIKPVIQKFLWGGKRVILKSKNEKWSEKSKERKTKKIVGFTEEAQKILDGLILLITENRLRNVLSKIGEVTNKDFGKIIGQFHKDIIEEFRKDYEDVFSTVEKEERKRITKAMGRKSAELLRKNFMNIIDGVF